MARGGVCKDVIESHPKFSRYDIVTAKADKTNFSTKTTSKVTEKHVSSSANGVYELLQCPVCAKLMYPPIHQRCKQSKPELHLLEQAREPKRAYCFWKGSNTQGFKNEKCPNGHTLCSNCKSRVENCCPTCHSELGNIRCLALERVAESLELPCRHKSLGCKDIFPYYSKLKHEQSCRFRPYHCPYAGSECTVTGDIPNLVAHLSNDHSVDMHDGCTFNHRYVKSNPHEVENATWMLTVFNCFGRQFCLHFEACQLGMAPVYISFLRFMGEDTDAKHFSYSLEVGGYGRKLTWQGVPRSIRDSHQKVRDSQDGLVIPRKLALFFSGGNRKELKLRVIGHIWKE